MQLEHLGSFMEATSFPRNHKKLYKNISEVLECKNRNCPKPLIRTAFRSGTLLAMVVGMEAR